MRIQAMIVVVLLLGAKLACAESLREQWPVLGNEKDPDAMEQVVSGASEIASAAWWGFDSEDSTEFLQGAIDSGAKTVIVPYMGNPWVVRPINLRSNLTLLFAPGVVVLAKKGEFKGRNDSLFLAVDETDITLRGYGARFVMHKEDYQSDAYEKAEWRMGIRLLGCSNVTIEGIRIEKSGGDGIYVGTGKQPYCKDIVIRNVHCADNHRQGISVIGAENLLIENCMLSGTNGTPPQAGIDFEPNRDVNKMVNCVMRNCVLEDNTGPAILIYLSHLSGDSDPVSIRAENCFVRSGKGSGIAVSAVRDTGPEGAIEFKNCTIERTQIEGIHVHAKSADRVRVRFLNCRCKAVCLKECDPDEAGKDQPAPIQLTSDDPKITMRHGGIDFVNCSVYDTVDRPALAFYDKESGSGVHDVQGKITVRSPYPARMEVQCKPFNVGLKMVKGQAWHASAGQVGNRGSIVGGGQSETVTSTRPTPVQVEPEFKTLLLVKATDKNRRYGEGDIVELKDGRLCFIYTQYTGGWRDAHTANIVIRTSGDGGETWMEPRVLISRAEAKQNVMSTSILRLKSGELLLFYLRKNSLVDCQLHVRRSTDEFDTLSDPVRVSVDDGYAVCHNDRAVQLSSGRILLPTSVHTIYKQENGKRKREFFRSGAAKVYYSDDGGCIWHGDVSQISPKSITQHEPGLVELKDGRIWMYMRTTQGAIYGCYSSDGGVHWTEPKATALKSPEAPATIERIPWTGDLLCVWNDHTGYHGLPRTIRSPLCLAISKDEGKTWSKPRVLEAGPPDDGWRSVWLSYYSYTSMTFVKDQVILSYWDTENRAPKDRWYSLKVVAFNRDWLYWD